jgi:protein-tyrosine kinase
MKPSLISGQTAPKRSSAFDDNAVDAVDSIPHDGAMGALIKGDNPLTPAQIDRILEHQREEGMRFGESAVALGLATHEDVLRALARQFQYPYTTVRSDATNQELVIAANPFSDQAESFRELRSQLMLGTLAASEPRRALSIISPNVGDGKTFIAANLAVSFSQLGVHTLLIDLDMRTPRQHKVFGVDNSTGLSNILSGRSEANVIRPVKDLPTLFVLPVGTVPPNPLELVQRPALGMLIRELLTKFDYIVVDTPAASHGADARVVASLCGAALAVGREGTSQLRALQKVIGMLNRTPVAFAGVVINER